VASGRVVRSLATPIDGLIPFLPWSVWVYLLGLVLIALPAFVPSSRSHFRRTALAYGVVLVVSQACFALFPVTSLGLRPDVAQITSDGPTSWALRQLYAIDPEYNLCPSLHVSLCALAALSIRRVSRPVGAAALAMAALVAISVCTVKQHFALDVIAGVCLAAAAQIVVRGSLRTPVWR